MNISKRLGASLLTAALVLGPIAAATASPAEAATQAAPSTLSLFKASNRKTIIETFDGINAFRASKGLKPLKFNVAVASISQKWSNRMAASREFTHNSDYVSGAPAGWDAASENIAWYTWAPSGQRFVDMWIDSPAHNAQMSRPGDDYMGIGISSRNGATYATANHFSYRDGIIPAGSYNHPRDYFNGRPALSGAATVTAPAPAFHWTTGRYTIPARAGVTYSVEGKMLKAGTHKARNRKVVITAKAVPGYKLSGPSSWSGDFRRTAAPVRPAMSSKSNRYTIPKQAGVTFLVNGKAVKAGTYRAPNAKTLKFTAETASPTYRLTGTAAWSYRF
ncbi:CAP domain-containing protein [Pseudarthrobacter sp. PvP090]|uniref:CAP domain-containing protein n=1 Tax=Pseudarthrobacter sp. PvP090 TaxID=3156393 RepID=UPI0033933C36